MSIVVALPDPVANTASLLTVSLTAGEALNYGDVCYVKAADGKLYKAQSDGTAAEAEAQFIVVNAGGILINVAGSFAPNGIITGLSGGTAGALAYLSATAGGTTTTAPVYGVDVTLYTKIIGRWISSTVLYFDACPGIAPQFNG